MGAGRGVSSTEWTGAGKSARGWLEAPATTVSLGASSRIVQLCSIPGASTFHWPEWLGVHVMVPVTRRSTRKKGSALPIARNQFAAEILTESPFADVIVNSSATSRMDQPSGPRPHRHAS